MHTQQVTRVNDCCDIVDCPAFTVIGVAATLHAESKTNVYQLGKKYLRNGTIATLAERLGRERGAVVGVCTDSRGAGHLTYTIGVAGELPQTLPVALPEDGAVVTCPGGRYARLQVQGLAGAEHDVAMQVAEYFIGGFRHDTPYVFDSRRPAFHHYAPDGRLLALYQPVKEAHSLQERCASLRITPVELPALRCACRMLPMDGGGDVIGSYFAVQAQVQSLPVAHDHDQEYWGFPYRRDGVLHSCFGSRVSDFQGVPECVEHLTVPGGLCAHLAQAELNGDNPSLLYEVAFNHLQPLFFDAHPEYAWDESRYVYARFRLGTSASIFVPLRLAGAQ